MFLFARNVSLPSTSILCVDHCRSLVSTQVLALSVALSLVRSLRLSSFLSFPDGITDGITDTCAVRWTRTRAHTHPHTHTHQTAATRRAERLQPSPCPVRLFVLVAHCRRAPRWLVNSCARCFVTKLRDTCSTRSNDDNDRSQMTKTRPVSRSLRSTRWPRVTIASLGWCSFN
jgi:hypothetical protein